jgi:hypothetical protein
MGYKRLVLMVVLAGGLTGLEALAQAPAGSTENRLQPHSMSLDLTKPFHTRSPWRFVVTEGPPTQDYGGVDAPGALTVCLYKGSTGPCVSDPVNLPLRKTTPEDPIAWEPHYLFVAKVVYPQGPGAAPFLMIVTGSLLSGDSDEIVSTLLITYDAGADTFRRVFGKSTGHNNNQEIRFITDGPLQGSVISAEPQDHLPYGYWIVVDQLSPKREYRQVLRYASATRYNDGNRLAVIDSEMPSIERRLGLWKPGDPLPVPDHAGGKPCLKPTLRHDELWCE